MATATPTTGDRSERFVMAATGLLALLFGTAAFWPAATFEEEFGRLARLEGRAITAWQSIVADSQAGKLSEPQAADRIDREVLPIWKQARARLSRLETGKWANRLPKRLSEAFRLREEAWTEMAAAARGDEPATRRAQNAWRAADQVLVELRQGNGGAPAAP